MKKLSEAVKLPSEIIRMKKENLDALCQDPFIQSFMQTYQLKRSMMDDYWIELINYYEDKEVCRHCPGIEQCPKNTLGYQMSLQFENQRVALSMHPCAKEAVRQLKRNTLELIEPCNMPKSIFDIPLDELELTGRKDVLLVCQKLALNLGNKGLYLYGPIQNGKTTVMAALIYRLALKKIPCGFVNVPGLIAELKEQFSYNDGKSDLMHQLKSVDVLVLDDIGGENVTAWSRDEVLSAIINERALRKLPTFFTSVYSLDELKKYYVLSKQKGDTIKVERLIEKMKAVSMIMELKSAKFNM